MATATPQVSGIAAHLWPRQEVLHLVLPQFSHCSRGPLTQHIAIDALRQMKQVQSADAKISFDRWFVVAKNVFKWNDALIKLFWSLVVTATHYTAQQSGNTTSAAVVDGAESAPSVSIVYLALFLMLHVNDHQRPTSPNTHFETMWPAAAEGDLPPPSSPNSSSYKRVSNLSPKSPGSPLSSPRSMTHKRSAVPTSPRMSKTSVQNLHAVRHKLPLLLAVVVEDPSFLDDLEGSFKEKDGLFDGHSIGSSQSGSFGARRPSIEALRISDSTVSRRALDSLRFVIGGGSNRDDETSRLSLLHPRWAVHHQQNNLRTASSVSSPLLSGSTIIDENESISYSELLTWLDSHLAVNDVVYPSASSPTSANGPAAATSAGFFLRKQLEFDESSINPNAFLNGFEDRVPSAVTIGATHQPERILTATSSLARTSPLVLMGCSSTYMFVAGTGPHSNNSINSSNNSSLPSNQTHAHKRHMDEHGDHLCNLLERHGLSELRDQSDKMSTESLDKMQESSGGGSDNAMSDTGSGNDNNNNDSNRWKKSLADGNKMKTQSHSTDRGSDGEPDDPAESRQAERGEEEDRDSSKPSRLPMLTISNCHGCPMYLLSPFFSGNISACRDADLVVGPVYGAVTVSNCERVRLTIACRHLIVQNCFDCEFNIATTQPTVIAGDSRGLVFGPYNTTYRGLRHHLRTTRLLGLAQLATPDSDEAADFASVGSSPTNAWSKLCDMNACLDVIGGAGSPSGYAIDAVSDNAASIPLPFPTSTLAVIQPADKFIFVAIPYKSEHQTIEAAAIPVPKLYLSEQAKLRGNALDVHQRLIAMQPAFPPVEIIGSGGDGQSHPLQAPGGGVDAVLQHKFMEWLLETGKAKELVELVKLDAQTAPSPSSH